jgi:TPR repeat protein
MRRRHVPALLREAVEIVPPACADHDGSACSILGVMSEVGAGVPRDRGRARWAYRRACNAGNMHGCGNLGELLLADLEPGANQGAALALLHRSCDAGKLRACDVLLGHACVRGEGAACLTLAALRTACARGSDAACARIEGLPPSFDADEPLSSSAVARGH